MKLTNKTKYRTDDLRAGVGDDCWRKAKCDDFMDGLDSVQACLQLETAWFDLGGIAHGLMSGTTFAQIILSR